MRRLNLGVNIESLIVIHTDISVRSKVDVDLKKKIYEMSPFFFCSNGYHHCG